MRKLILAGLIPLALLLAGCGGGSGSGSGSVLTSTNGTGGGGQAANVVTMTVESGPTGTNDVDTPFVTLTICAPGSTSNCEQIDHVEVDTGSYGVRILSTALTSTLAAALPQEPASTGGSLVECTQFLDGYSWGPVKTADVQVGGETASNVPIQVIGDPNYEGEIPTSCSSTAGRQENTVGTFGANGIIGVGPFGADCGGGCDLPVTGGQNPGWYYGCPSGGTSSSDCTQVMVGVDSQVTNPVVLFTATGDDNGVIIEMPPVPDPDGAATATGSLVFGIGTESNNRLGSNVTILTADPNYGDITTTYNGTSLPNSYFDTGSNGYYFDASALAQATLPDCPSSSGASGASGWLCPTTEQTLSLQNQSYNNGTISDVSINIYNANTLFTSPATQGNTAFDDLGGDTGSQSSYCPSSTTDCYFDFGLPFFFGRDVYIAIAGANTSGGGMGPYFAY